MCALSKHTQVSLYVDLIGTFFSAESAGREADKHTHPSRE